MIHRSWWMNSCATLLCLWEETGENLALFCYRMVWGTFSVIRAGALPQYPRRLGIKPSA